LKPDAARTTPQPPAGEKTENFLRKVVDARAAAAVASRAATRVGGRETGKSSEAGSPGRLFCPLDGRSLTSVTQHGACHRRRKNHSANRVGPPAKRLGREKKIELCAACGTGRFPSGRARNGVRVSFGELGFHRSIWGREKSRRPRRGLEVLLIVFLRRV
jgi:hypothetical protein